MELRCDSCREVKSTGDLAKWKLDGEILCKDCQAEDEAEGERRYFENIFQHQSGGYYS